MPVYRSYLFGTRRYKFNLIYLIAAIFFERYRIFWVYFHCHCFALHSGVSFHLLLLLLVLVFIYLKFGIGTCHPMIWLLGDDISLNQE